MSPYLALFPEIFLSLIVAILLMLNAYLKSEGKLLIYRITNTSLIIVLAVISYNIINSESAYLFSNNYYSGYLGRALGFISTAVVLLIFIISKNEVLNKFNSNLKGEFYPLVLTSLIGVLLVIGGYSMIMIYLGIELMSLSIYALIAMRYRVDGPTIELEAAIKYFILGSLASGLLLYGISMIYGATGSIYINEISKAVINHGANTSNTALIFGLVFIVAGLSFKFGLVPFHNWVPDVYQGSPLIVTALISSIPKIAILAASFRILLLGFFPLANNWQLMLLILAILSIGLGNVAAIAQKNIKRMLGYSAISQIGFVILGFITALGANTGVKSFLISYSGAFFYIFAYVIASVLAFGILIYLTGNALQRSSNEAGDHEFSDLVQLSGLGKTSPLLAFLMMLAMFSMAGIPPFVGFYAKLIVLQNLISAGYLYVALLAIAFSLVGAFYYLRVIKIMYFDTPLNYDAAKPALSHDKYAYAGLSFLGILVVLIGLIPSSVMSYFLVSIYALLQI